MSSAFCNYVLWSVTFMSLLHKTINNSIKIFLWTLFFLFFYFKVFGFIPVVKKVYNTTKLHDFQYLNKNIISPPSKLFYLNMLFIYKSLIDKII